MSDSISRHGTSAWLENMGHPNLAKMIMDEKRFPSAQPKKGKWVRISPAKIYECSICGQNVMTDDIECYRFCHGCGADMRGKK